MTNRYTNGTAPELARERNTGDLRTYFTVLSDNRWLIIAVAALVSLAGVLYAVTRAPVYETNLTIRTEEPSPTATKNVLTDASSLFETKKTTTAEIELLRSRRVIAPAVDKLRLDISAVPKRFPFMAQMRFGSGSDGLSTPGLFGRGGYAWGNERMDVSVFNVPESLLDHTFNVTALDGGRYAVEAGGMRWEGMTGRLERVRTSAGEIVLQVDRIDARPGARFFLSRKPKQAVVAAIQSALVISELGKQSGVIEVKLQGEDPVQVRDILNEIGQEYLRRNHAYTAEQTDTSLAFLEQQLPVLQRQLERAEAAYNAFRRQYGTVNLGEEARINLQQSAAAKLKRFDLLQKRNELLTRLGENHPTVVGMNKQLADVDAEIGSGVAAVRSLPDLEQRELALTRDIKVNTELYTAMSNTAQQLRMLAASRVGNVRIVDTAALPDRPVKPNRTMLVFAATIFGLLLGTAAAFLRRTLRGRIDSAAALESTLGAKVVLANIPHSSQQKQLRRHARGDAASIPLLAHVMPDDPAIEGLRSFRAALQFAMPGFRNNIVMITGPGSNLGKSFVSANTAAIVAASGKRVLLIDMDLRNGELHRYFGTEQENGLVEVVAGAPGSERGIRRNVVDNLDFLPTGAWTSNRHEFFMQRSFDTWLKSVSTHYDLVLVDAPPVLAVADASIIGTHAGAVFIVARAGVTTEEEINESVRRLNQAGITPEGILLNDAKLRRQAYGYPYRSVEPKRLAWKA